MFDKRTLALYITLVATVFARNDWTQPCISGSCSYDTGDGVKTAYSSLALNGDPSVLSDITTAAGWEISGCNPGWKTGAANVVVTCTGSAKQMAHCDHLFQGGNAMNKVVRLPQDCGVGPFARVVRSSQVQRRDEGGPEMHALTLDYNFDQLPATGNRTLSFNIASLNAPSDVQGQRRRLYPLPRFGSFDKSSTINAPPIHLTTGIPLFNQSIDCPAADGGIGFSAALGVNADVTVDALVSMAFQVSGSILPPKLDVFKLTGTLNGSAAVDFDITANAHGSFSTGPIPIFPPVGIPGLDFIGIFTAGPEFLVNAQLDADLNLEADIKTGVEWTFPNVEVVFPPSQGNSSAQAIPGQRPLNLSVGTNVTASGNITGHLIPRVQVGVTILKFATAQIFVDLDTSATFGLQAEAGAAASTDGSSSTSLSGCAQLDAGVAIRAGAVGAIKPIFDDGINFTIFSEDVNIAKQCFGKPSSKREYVGLLESRHVSHVEKRNLLCPSLGEGGVLESVLSL
ncbi:hypothetical protein EXIGLDRAFT_745081 [Exidia glandulosa HHB12029]|uniref:DUF7223 domain-containing protein n=1 Tax=Exidia glandulosa HHB12029 TaxID=1314781 RepID=A0A165P245_EXIGL|nr:hypothetical protein EXIGLDRAFT_745081 [Exidia glandulosa HHB12029]